MDIRKNIPVNGAAYGLALLGTIIGDTQDIRPLVYLCKPLLLLILSSWFFFSSRRVGDRFTLLVQAGLFFSLVGDVALMLPSADQFYFLIGLAAFLMAHLCYTMAFAQNIADAGPGAGPLVPLLIAIALVAFGFFFALDLVPKVDDSVSLPVIIYVVAITLMGIAAAFRFGRTFPRSFMLVMAGAVLFILSDALLATNRFMKPLGHAAWSVMLTYGLAQLLIAAGCLAHVLDPEEVRRRAALDT